MIALAILALALAALPTAMTMVNLAVLRVPDPAPPETQISILIPARDEAREIEGCVIAALASTGVACEVIVLDDHSQDATAAIVARLAAHDSRLRLAPAPALPPGWTGKVHACHVLAALATTPHLVFIDADVRLMPQGASRLAGALAGTDLVSGVPRQRMGSLAELLAIPMINGVLLGYLPILLARRDPRPSLGAACGQMIAVRADAYAQAGGHAAVKASLHDGLTLPRRFRAAGLRTDLVAGSALATCRMYEGWRAVVHGVTKNATEGMAQPKALPVWTLLLLGGHVLPWAVLVAALAGHAGAAVVLAALACAGPLAARLLQALACREPIAGVPLHPFGVCLLVALQWVALARKWAGRPQSWRGRRYLAGG